MKLMLVGMVSCLSLGAMAQAGRAAMGTTTLGITGGVNWNNINGKNATGADLNNDLKTGFNGGLNLEVPLGSGFFVQPGIEYRRKGAELENGNKLNLSYIDVPVNLMYKPALGTGTMLLGFGPYIGLGINGKVISPDGTERKVIFNNDYAVNEAQDLQFKHLDAGANFTAGYEFRSKLSMSLKAQLGLININPDTNIPNDETRNRNTGFGFSLGYRL